jgi:hypothetical protein
MIRLPAGDHTGNILVCLSEKVNMEKMSRSSSIIQISGGGGPLTATARRLPYGFPDHFPNPTFFSNAKNLGSERTLS